MTENFFECQTAMEIQQSQRCLYTGQIISLFCDTVTLPTGKAAQREVVKHPGGVAVVAQLPNQHIVLVKQFRYALQHALIELPAGKLDSGEEPLQAIQRELEEETGYLAQHWRQLTTIYPAPGFCNERITLFYATGLTLDRKSVV